MAQQLAAMDKTSSFYNCIKTPRLPDEWWTMDTDEVLIKKLCQERNEIQKECNFRSFEVLLILCFSIRWSNQTHFIQGRKYFPLSELYETQKWISCKRYFELFCSLINLRFVWKAHAKLIYPWKHWTIMSKNFLEIYQLSRKQFITLSKMSARSW